MWTSAYYYRQRLFPFSRLKEAILHPGIWLCSCHIKTLSFPLPMINTPWALSVLGIGFVWNISTHLKISSRIPVVGFQKKEYKFPHLGREKNKRALIIFTHDWGAGRHSREEKDKGMNTVCFRRWNLLGPGGTLIPSAQEDGTEVIIIAVAAEGGGDLVCEVLEKGSQDPQGRNCAPWIPARQGPPTSTSALPVLMVISPLQAAGAE